MPPPIAGLVGIGVALVMANRYSSLESGSSGLSDNGDNPWHEVDYPPARQISGNNVQPSSTASTDDRRTELRKIAEETLRTLKKGGGYTYKGVDYHPGRFIKEAQEKTQYYAPDNTIARWATTERPLRDSPPAHVSVLQISTLDGARLLESVYKNSGDRARTGVLNFASATQPGGGFLNGAEAQEESIARSSTLFPTLTTGEAKKFYELHQGMQHTRSSRAFYSHAIIYSPRVVVFRDDDGVWTYPFEVDVLSCAAVNAGEIRRATQGPVISGVEVEIEREMDERMGRILYVFEQHGVRNLVLGTFGTGVFRNSVAVVARLWAHLLTVPDARFKNSFDRIIFAIIGGETFAEFQSAFDAWGQKRQPEAGPSRRSGRDNLIQL